MENAQYSFAWVKLGLCVMKIGVVMESLQIAKNRKLLQEHISGIRLFGLKHQISTFLTSKIRENGIVSRQKGEVSTQ